jgi:hypothetical protein
LSKYVLFCALFDSIFLCVISMQFFRIKLLSTGVWRQIVKLKYRVIVCTNDVWRKYSGRTVSKQCLSFFYHGKGQFNLSHIATIAIFGMVYHLFYDNIWFGFLLPRFLWLGLVWFFYVFYNYIWFGFSFPRVLLLYLVWFTTCFMTTFGLVFYLHVLYN